jgi:hypothetical protein
MFCLPTTVEGNRSRRAGYTTARQGVSGRWDCTCKPLAANAQAYRQLQQGGTG